MLRFFRWYCHPGYQEDIEGDLWERFERNLGAKGATIARWLFMKDVLLLFRPGIIRNVLKTHRMTRFGIVKNYFVTAARNSKKEKAFAILNVLCLTLGFTACLYIGLYSVEELSYDTFHEKAERIYRVNQTFIWGGTDKLFGSTGPAVMDAIMTEVPEFETMTRVHTVDDALVSNVAGGTVNVFEENRIYGADPNFFEVFTFPLLRGNPKTALANPNSIVVTKSIADKYFGGHDILGKQLAIGEKGNEEVFQITGVAADIPSNSHINFNFLMSMSSFPRLKRQQDSWWWTTFVTFGVLRPDANAEIVAEKVANVPGKYLEAFLQKYRGISYREFLASGESWDLYIQPLLDIHLRSTHVIPRLNEVGDIKTLYVLGAVAMLILLLSVINFVNLSTARSSRRTKEVGVRKVLGSSRQSLVWQFILECILFCFIAVALSVVLVKVLMPVFNSISGKEIAFNLINNPALLTVTLLATLIIGFLAGIYPAFYLSAFKPSQVLKGHLALGGGSFVRNSLVTIQFTVSIALIACSLIVNKQVQFWLNMDLGFDRENKLIIQNVERLESSIDAFQSEILEYSQVRHVSYSSGTPPYVGDNDGNFYLKGNNEVSNKISYWMIDENFVNTYGLKLIAGRNFGEGFDDRKNVLVSRSLTKAFGIARPEEAIDEHLIYSDYDKRIIGVFEDINSELHWEQLPIALFYKDEFTSPFTRRELTVTFKEVTSGDEVSSLLEDIESKWQKFNPNAPFKYTFLDQEYEMIFESTIKFGRLMNLYSILAILIASLGLTGLIAYTIERRNKEIGIRKVLGAPILSILALLTGKFGKLLLIGFSIASVTSWYIMNSWVEDFVYQAPISASTFLLSGIIMFMVALVTLSFQTIKAAMTDPVNSLRDE